MGRFIQFAVVAFCLAGGLGARQLPDFSFAGYQRGERALPAPAVTHNLRDFGAKGDGVTDDSAAFLRAVTEVTHGVILIPRGRYVLTQIVEIKKPNLVLRGEDRDGTVIYCPKPLQEIRPHWSATTGGQKTSNYSWAGGMIQVLGSFNSHKLAAVIAPAKRGENEVHVDSVAGLAIGQEVELFEHDTPVNTLASRLYDGDPGPTGELKGSTTARLTARIVRLDGDRVVLDRALRCDVELEWQPELRKFAPNVTEVGIENLTFEFPVTPYAGHFTEQGYNPLAFGRVANCWARNLRVVNADSGVFVAGQFCTIDGIVMESARPADTKLGATGHHGTYIEGNDNLYTHFDFRTKFVHDLSVSHCTGNVFSVGRGVDLCLDHHKRAPYANLFTALDAGAGTRLWHCGGGAALGKHCAGGGTFWNISAARPLAPPPADFGPATLHLELSAQTPSDLHDAQLLRRLKAQGREHDRPDLLEK
jgi:hypothetical protein